MITSNYKKKRDWISIILWILIILSISYVIYYFVLERVNTCTEDPLKFAINKIKDSYDVQLVSGTLTYIDKDGKTLYNQFGDNLFSNETTWSFSNPS